jgi:hypothetical protein
LSQICKSTKYILIKNPTELAEHKFYDETGFVSDHLNLFREKGRGAADKTGETAGNMDLRERFTKKVVKKWK